MNEVIIKFTIKKNKQCFYENKRKEAIRKIIGVFANHRQSLGNNYLIVRQESGTDFSINNNDIKIVVGGFVTYDLVKNSDRSFFLENLGIPIVKNKYCLFIPENLDIKKMHLVKSTSLLKYLNKVKRSSNLVDSPLGLGYHINIHNFYRKVHFRKWVKSGFKDLLQ